MSEIRHSISKGAHIALLHESDDFTTEVIRDFIHEGLSRKERVFYLADTGTTNQCLEVCDSFSNSFLRAYQTGQLVLGSPVSPPAQSSLAASTSLASLLGEEIEEASSNGYRGIRVVEDMEWVLRGSSSEGSLLEYEVSAASLVIETGLNLLCQYDMRRFHAQLLLDAISCHSHVFLGRDLCENMFHLPPAELLNKDRARVLLDQCLTKIRKRKAEQDALMEYKRCLESRDKERSADLEVTHRLLLHKAEERSRLLDELSESEERYRSFFFGNHMVMLLFDSDTGDIIDANPAANRFYGYKRSELIGMNVSSINQLSQDQLSSAMRDAREGKRAQFYFKHKLANGEIRDVEVFTGPVILRGRKLLYSLVNDISHQKLLEMQLHQAQKMEAIGQLAGGVAHDFNNLISVIMGYSELAMEGLPVGDLIREELGEVLKAAIRAKKVTQQLLAFSRKQTFDLQVINPNQLIQDVSNMLRRLVGETIRINVDLDPNLASVLVDPGQIQQILMNLMVNSKDAMPKGGSVTIQTRNTSIVEGITAAEIGLEVGDYVVITVSDTGCGIPPGLMEKVFEPFFTTKEKGKGTGLGLSTVHGIVRQHGGGICLMSEQGKGTTFEIYLPRSSQPVCVKMEAVPIRTRAKPGESILIVEDDDNVRTLAKCVLGKHEYQVLDASGPREALDLVGYGQYHIHMLLTDVVMPEMNGWDLYQQLLLLIPDLKVVFMSGYPDEVLYHEGFSLREVPFIQKPFVMDELLTTIRNVLDGS